MHAYDAGKTRLPRIGAGDTRTVPDRHAALFRVGQSNSGFAPKRGHAAHLMADSDATITSLVANIDTARDHVHLLFYIWLPDGNGTRVDETLIGRPRVV